MKIRFCPVYCFIAFLSITILTSCEEDFILKREAFVPKIVVNSIFAEGKPWHVALSFSRDILDKESEITPVENADVYVVRKTNGLEIPLKHEGNGIYTSYIYLPEADRNYELIVDVPGYETIKAKSNSPSRSEIVNVLSEVVEWEGAKKTKVNFEIKDQNKNFYIWNLIVTSPSKPIDSSFTGNSHQLVSSIKKYNAFQSVLNNTVLLSNDVESQGGYFSTTSNVVVEDDSGNGNSEEDIEFKKKYLRVLTVSEDMYAYYKSVDRFFNPDNQNSSLTFIGNIHSNISNGLGIFAALHADTIFFDVIE